MSSAKHEESAWSKTIRGKPEQGAIANRSRTTSLRDIELFTEITGDKNPIHYDETLASSTPFGGLIVQGGVTSGLLNAIVAEDLPGPGTVFLGVEWKFVKAVKVGETITARVQVDSVRDDKPICKLSTTVLDSDDDECLTGSATTYTVPLK